MKTNSPFKTYITFSKNIQIIVISEAICALAFGIYSFLQILYLNNINMPANQIGIIFSVGSIFSLLGFIIGPFVKIVGRKNVLSSGCLISALGIATYIFFNSFFILLLGQILTNMGLCFIQVTELQLLYSYTTPDKECCAYSYKFSVNFISSAIGGLLAGNINKFGIFKNIGYKHLFALSIILLVITFTIRFLFLPKEGKVKGEKGEIRKNFNNSINLLKNDKRIQVFSFCLFILSVGGSAIWPYSNLVLKNNFNLGNNLISVVSFIITTFNMTGLIVMPALIEKFTINKIEKILFILLSFTNLILFLNLNIFVYLPVLILRYFAAGLIGSSLDTSMMSHVNTEYRDVFAGVKILVNSISVAIGNFIGGVLINTFRYNFCYLYGAILCAIAGTFFYIKVREYLEHIEFKKPGCCKFKYNYIASKR